MTIKIKRAPKSAWSMKNNFTVLPNFVLQQDLGIDLAAKSVLLTLLSRARWGGRPTVTVTTLPTSYSVFEKSGLYRNTISGALKTLDKAGFIASERENRRRPAVYTIYLAAIEAAALRSTRATTQQSTRATTNNSERSTRATTERSTRATTTKKPVQGTSGSSNNPNQPTGLVGEVTTMLHPSATVYPIDSIKLSPKAAERYARAVALIVVGYDKFLVAYNHAQNLSRLADGEWKMINKHHGKCEQCGKHVAKGVGIFENGKPQCIEHHSPDNIVVGVGSFEEFERYFFTEEELFGGKPTAYDHVRLADEVIDNADR